MAFAKRNPKIPEGINASTENPLKEFFLLFVGVVMGIVFVVAVLSVMAHSLAHTIPFSFEQKLVTWFSDLDEHFGEDNDDRTIGFDEAERALLELGARLQGDADLPEDMALQFHLIDAPDIPNAFATLGGNIFVTTGLLGMVDTENALSMVVAHEIAHVKLRHPAKALSGGVIVQVFMSLVFGSQGGSVLQSGLGQSGLLTMLSFSRAMELEADAEAIATLRRHYGHLVDADAFFQAMLAAQASPAWQEVLQTHPGVERRIEGIRREQTILEQTVREQTRDDEPRPLDSRFQQLKAELNVR